MDLVRELRASDVIVAERLEALQAAGLVSPEADGTFRYAPAAPTWTGSCRRSQV